MGTWNGRVIAFETAVAVALILLTYFGTLVAIWEHDTYYISSLIAMLTVCGLISRKVYIEQVLSGLMVRLGLLGTIIGFTSMLHHLGTASQGELQGLFDGIYVALHTTGVGITASTLLWLHSLLIGGGDDE